MGMMTEFYAKDMLDLIDFSNGGGVYSPRHKNHNINSNLSKHSWAGVAFDINPHKYPRGSDVKPPQKVLDICAKWGYYSGYYFRVRDPMHQEFFRFPI